MMGSQWLKGEKMVEGDYGPGNETANDYEGEKAS